MRSESSGDWFPTSGTLERRSYCSVLAPQGVSAPASLKCQTAAAITHYNQWSLHVTASFPWVCSMLYRKCSLVCVMEERERLKRKCEVLSTPFCLWGSERSDKSPFSLHRHQCNELHWINYSDSTGRKATVRQCYSVWFSTSKSNYFYILNCNNRKHWHKYPIFPLESRESSTSEPVPSQLCLKSQHLLVLPPGSLELKLMVHWEWQSLLA